MKYWVEFAALTMLCASIYFIVWLVANQYAIAMVRL